MLQVDHHDIAAIGAQEAVARIKEKTHVTLTVLRGVAYSPDDQHVYDEIFYSDSQLSQQSLSQQEDMSFNLTAPRPPKGGSKLVVEETAHHRQLTPSSSAGSGGGSQWPKPVHRVMQQTMPPTSGVAMEKGSRDSGLSSGSSTHHDGSEETPNRRSRHHQQHQQQQHQQHQQQQHQRRQGRRHERVGSQGSQGSQSSGSLEGNYESEVCLCVCVCVCVCGGSERAI